MSTDSKPCGHLAISRPGKRHDRSIQLIVGICIRVIFISTVFHASTSERLQLWCNEINDHDEWSATYDNSGCSDEENIFVTRAQGHLKGCEHCYQESDMILGYTKDACDRKNRCQTSLLGNISCKKYEGILVSYTCNNSVEEIKPKPTTDKNNGYRGVTDTGKDGVTDTGKDGVTDAGIDGINMTGKTGQESVNMYVVTIVVVSVVAIAATAFAVTLCLLFFCCQKSPLYRGSTVGHRHPQQHQEEYASVDESKFQVLKPSLGNNVRHNGVFCVGPTKATTSQAYNNTITSDDDDYDEISSNESLGPPNRKSSSVQPTPSSITVSLQSELMKSLKSKSGSPRLEGGDSSSPNLQDHNSRPSIRQTTVGFSGTPFSPTSHASAASFRDLDNSVNDEVSGRHRDVSTECLQQQLYSDASSSSLSPSAGPVVYHTMKPVTGEYACLVRPGEGLRVTENVYDG